MGIAKIRRLTIHGMLFQAVFRFGFSPYMAFMATTLMDYGQFSGAAAGVITAMSVIVMMAQPVYGHDTDPQN